MNDIDWKNIRVLIFDVDGTLYNQKKLRQKMFFSLMLHYLFRPHKWTDLLILKTFRSERERNKSSKITDLQTEQYEWCQAKTGKDINRIKHVVQYWIMEYPLRFLPGLTYPGIHELFQALHSACISVAVLSDYPAAKKLEAMKLQADLIIDATDQRINCLKPDPAGLKYIADHFDTNPQNIVFIGDKEDIDGEAARRINMHSLIIDKEKKYTKQFFTGIIDNIARR